MAHVQVFHLGAVFEALGILRGEHAPHRGLGGQDALGIGTHAVAVPEPDSPDHFHVRELVPDSGHLLVAQAAAVHIQILQVRHAPERRFHRSPAVIHRYILQIQTGLVQGGLHSVQLPIVAQFQLRECAAYLRHVLPAEALPGLAQLYAAEVGQAGGGLYQGRHILMLQFSHVQSRYVVGDGAAVGQRHGIAHRDLRMGLGPGIYLLIALASPQVRSHQPLHLIQLGELLGSYHHGNAECVLLHRARLKLHRRRRRAVDQSLAPGHAQYRRQGGGQYHYKLFLVHFPTSSQIKASSSVS